ncbi:hypothetical protein HYS72_01940 [Candidatus Pacearchaeota archaeon]|nr:hypothetical protein [Candidatus Pacearchaeota archaeon]MBI2057102.1 hypothetical protein [Candidatus Pacearchaeota archaeon]
MDKGIKLTEKELLVLRVCDEEPGDIESIQRELKDKLSKEKIKGILDRLLKLKLVYKDEGLWIITVEGARELSN